MHAPHRFFGLALTTVALGFLACSDVGGDTPGDAGTTGSSRGGSAGSGAAGTGGSGGGQSDGGRDVSALDVAGDARADISSETGTGGAAGATSDASRDGTDARIDSSAGGTAGTAGGAGAGAGGKAGASGGTGAGGSAGATGGAGAAGSGGTGGAGTGGMSGAAGSAGSFDAGGGAAGAAGAPVDASVDTGPTSDGALIIEGGRDAVTTTTEAILTAAAADCLSCANDAVALGDACDLTKIRCETFPDLARQISCLDTLACIFPPGAGVSCVVPDTGALTPCYCGTNTTEDCIAGKATDGGVPGVCRGFIEVGFPGQTASFIAKNLSNIDYGPGRAMKIAVCASTSLTQNAPPDERCRACF